MRRGASRTVQLGVCTDNRGYPASIEVGKLYSVIPDAEAAKHGYIRVVDESGEDYGYSADRFFMLEVPEVLAQVLGARSGVRGRRRGRTSKPVVRTRERVSV